MDQSAAERIIARELPGLKRRLGLTRWDVGVNCDFVAEEGYTGQCWPDPDYEIAAIEIDPARTKTRAELLALLRHELFHAVLSPYDVAKESVEAMLKEGSPEAAIFERVWRHAEEQAVISLERMYAGLTRAKGAREG